MRAEWIDKVATENWKPKDSDSISLRIINLVRTQNFREQVNK